MTRPESHCNQSILLETSRYGVICGLCLPDICEVLISDVRTGVDDAVRVTNRATLMPQEGTTRI